MDLVPELTEGARQVILELIFGVPVRDPARILREFHEGAVPRRQGGTDLGGPMRGLAILCLGGLELLVRLDPGRIFRGEEPILPEPPLLVGLVDQASDPREELLAARVARQVGDDAEGGPFGLPADPERPGDPRPEAGVTLVPHRPEVLLEHHRELGFGRLGIVVAPGLAQPQGGRLQVIEGVVLGAADHVIVDQAPQRPARFIAGPRLGIHERLPDLGGVGTGGRTPEPEIVRGIGRPGLDEPPPDHVGHQAVLVRFG